MIATKEWIMDQSETTGVSWLTQRLCSVQTKQELKLTFTLPFN